MSPIRVSGFVPLIGYIYRYIASFYLYAQCWAPVTGQPSSFHILVFLSIRRCKLSRKLPPKFLRRRSGAVGAPIRLSTSVHLFTFEQTRVWFLFLFHWCELMYNSEFRKMKVTAKMFRLDPYGAELKRQKSTEINTCSGLGSVPQKGWYADGGGGWLSYTRTPSLRGRQRSPSLVCSPEFGWRTRWIALRGKLDK